MSTEEREIIKRRECLDILPMDSGETKRKLEAIRQFQAVVKANTIEGHDYGVIPGTNKPTLLKPGAEKIVKLLNLHDDYDVLEKVEDWDKPFFHYLIKCRLSDIASGVPVSAGIGSCNSMESKYRFRWVVKDDLPKGMGDTEVALLKSKGGMKTLFEPEFALDKRETEGKYGKPEAYWKDWEAAIVSGKAKRTSKKLGKKTFDGYERAVDTTLYQVANDDIFSQVNTLLKMAKKRALVDAALSVGRLSDLFTQDMEDSLPPDVAEAVPAEEIVDEGGNGGQRSAAPQEHKTITHPDDPISEKQLGLVMKLYDGLVKHGQDPEYIRHELKAKLEMPADKKLNSLKDLTKGQASIAIEFFKSWVDQDIER